MFWNIIDADVSLSAATKFSVPKAVKDASLGHIQKKVGEDRSTDEGVKLPAVIAGWCINSISPGFFRYICDVLFSERLNKVWCTIFLTKYINMFHLVLFSFRLQNILFDSPVGQEQAHIPGISDAAISGLETDVSRG